MTSASEARPAARGLPVVAIVGRPNVGKSTLFNRLVGAHRAIVDDAPGVTRDRVVAPAVHAGRAFLCVDTGGFAAEPPRDPAALAAQVRAQTLAAVAEADCVVCVLDGPAGLAPEDRETVLLLRRSGKPVVYAVNKLDTPAREPLLHDFHALGIEPLLPVSVAHGRGVADLLDALAAALPEGAPEASEARGTRLALIGRPNVGKSSLLNRLLGAERAIVAPEPGTTRDAIDTPLVVAGRPYVLIDTAGIRRRGRVEHAGVEQYSVIRSMKAISRSDVALLVIDATEGITAQDLHIAGYVNDEAKGIVVVVNKWDAVEKDDDTMEEYRERVMEALDFMPYAPLVFTSALHGQRVEKVPELALAVIAEREKRVPTPQLNRAVREAIAAHPTPDKQGRGLKFYYATQPRTAPPTFVFFVNDPKMLHFGYRRYLENRLRDAFGFMGTPIRISFRGRGED